MTLLSLFNNTDSTNKQTLLLGEDDLLNNYLADSLVKQKVFSNFEHVIIDCEVDGLDELIATLAESSLFSARKLVTVKNPFFLTGKTAKKFKKQISQLEQIFTHVDNLADVIVLIASYPKLDRRKKITKAVINNFNIVETAIKAYELENKFKALLKLEGYQIEPAAVKLLLKRSDQVLDTLLNNYRKLKMITPKNVITLTEVEQNVDLSLAQNVFAILESALDANFQEAIERLENQLYQGSKPVQLIAIFANQIEVLLVVKILAKRGRSESQIVKALGVHPYRVKLAMKNQLSISKLKRLLTSLIDLEYNYKTGTYRSDNFLKMFILSV